MRKNRTQLRPHSSSTGSNPTRREVLRGVAASALLPTAVLPTVRRSSNDPLDVAIVGGGVSGCYAAWRLANAGSSKESIRIFERGDRIGGRLYSVPCKGLTEQVAELGGMRIAENQTPLLGLVQTLGLETEPYPATEPDDLYYIRGIRTKARDLVCNEKAGFRPRPELEGKDPDEVFNILMKKLTGREDWTVAEFQAARKSMTYRGKNLYELPYEYAFREALGSEGFKFFFRTSGYGRPNVQALSFIEEATLSIFVENYYHVRGGYDQVPKRLAAAAGDKGVEVEFGTTLVDLRLDSDGLVRMTFDEKASPSRTVRARKAILAIPNTAYDLLDPAGALGGDNGMSRANRALEPDPAVKIYSNYGTQWWKPLGIRTGRSITDLPTRQCFYLPDPTGGGLVLAPYGSGPRATSYWRPLLQPSAPNQLDPSGLAAQAIQNQLSQLHGLEVPQAREILYRSFEGGYDGYAWNMWRPGNRYWEIVEEARTPLPGKPISCIGQATATSQGWVMDTLASAEAVMQKTYGLGRPDWWPADYPIG